MRSFFTAKFWGFVAFGHHLRRRVLRCHALIKQARVRVQSRRGKVVLTGTVASYYDKQIAQESLRGLPGIETVQNLLNVHWS